MVSIESKVESPNSFLENSSSLFTCLQVHVVAIVHYMTLPSLRLYPYANYSYSPKVLNYRIDALLIIFSFNIHKFGVNP